MGSKNLFSKEFRGGTIKGNAPEIFSLSSFMKHVMTLSSNKKLKGARSRYFRQFQH